jgi:hypothetical protein
MKRNPLAKDHARRVMYIENKQGLVDGARARIGWVTFSKTGRTLYYRGKSLKAIGGRGVSGNFIDEETAEEYWVSGVRKRGSNTHPAEAVCPVRIDEDAREEYARIRKGRA